MTIKLTTYDVICLTDWLECVDGWSQCPFNAEIIESRGETEECRLCLTTFPDALEYEMCPCEMMDYDEVVSTVRKLLRDQD